MQEEVELGLDLAPTQAGLTDDPGYTAHGSPTGEGLYLCPRSTGSGMVPSSPVTNLAPGRRR
jgi:hypothetical protein